MRPLGSPRLRWLDNIKVNLTEPALGLYGLDRSVSGWGPEEGSCEHGNEPSGSIEWEIRE
jgi:hypothetical protein